MIDTSCPEATNERLKSACSVRCRRDIGVEDLVDHQNAQRRLLTLDRRQKPRRPDALRTKQ